MTTILINAVLVGCIYGLIGLGISLAYGVARIVNWAYGNMLIFIMYITWFLVKTTTMDTLTVIPVTIVISIAIFFVVHKIIQPYVLAEDELGQLIMTLGISQIFYGLIHYIWGPRPKSILTSYALSSVHLGSVYIQLSYILVGLAGIIPVILVHIFIRKTWHGKALQAAAQNKLLIRMCGISRDSVFLWLTLFMGAIVGLASPLLFSLWGVQPSDGTFYTTLAFVVTLMLKRGNIMNALIAGIIISLAETLVQFYLGGWASGITTNILFLLLLLIRNVSTERGVEGSFS